MVYLTMNRPAEVGKFLPSGLGTAGVKLSGAKRLLEEAIVALREGDDHLLVFFLFVHRGRVLRGDPKAAPV